MLLAIRLLQWKQAMLLTFLPLLALWSLSQHCHDEEQSLQDDLFFCQQWQAFLLAFQGQLGSSHCLDELPALDALQFLTVCQNELLPSFIIHGLPLILTFFMHLAVFIVFLHLSSFQALIPSQFRLASSQLQLSLAWLALPPLDHALGQVQSPASSIHLLDFLYFIAKIHLVTVGEVTGLTPGTGLIGVGLVGTTFLS